MPYKYDEEGNIVVQEVGDKKLPLFVHPDGKEVPLDADGTIARIGQLNAEAKSHREGKEAAEAKLKAFGEIDPEAAKKALEVVKNIDDKKLVDSGKVEEVRAAAIKTMQERLDATMASFTSQKTELEKQVADMQSALHRAIVGGSFAKSQFIKDKLIIPPELAEAFFGKNFKVVDGKLAAFDDGGKPIGSRIRPGDFNVEFDEALEILVDGYANKAAILKGSIVKNGGGEITGRTGPSGRPVITRQQYEALPAESRAAALKDKDLVDA